jgi:4-carboxymuconolactone decarboxylase
MRRTLVVATLMFALVFALGLLAGTLATAQGDFVLRGGRFRPLSYAELNPAQKAVADAEIATGRKSFDGPTNINLRSPDMARASRPLNRYLRFEAPIEHKLKEIVILLTARFWGGQYVWYSHRAYAIEAGLSPTFIDAMAAGRRPDAMTPDEAAVYDFFSELLTTRQVSDTTFKTLADRVGERAIVELVGLMGHYHGTTALFAIDRYPLPNGAKSQIEKPM